MATRFSASRRSDGEGGAFEILPCNRIAHMLSMDVAQGNVPLGVISGPHGCGKSHLLLHTAEQAREQFGAQVTFISAAETDRPSFTFAGQDVVIIDDLEARSLGGRARTRFGAELERRVRSGRPTLCAASSAMKSLHSLLPFARRWKLAEMSEPTSEERHEILGSMCRKLQLNLVDDVLRTVSRLIRGDGRVLLGAAKRLKLISRHEADISPIRAAGVLDPLISKETGFDLRDIVVDCVSLSITPKLRRSDGFFQDQLTTYVLREEAMFAESNVADYLGSTPGEIYRLLRDAKNRLKNNDLIFAKKLDASKRLICRRLRDV